jgi:outer membrane protein assembly factor BamB
VPNFLPLIILLTKVLYLKTIFKKIIMKKINVVYILSGGRVAAINKKDGSIVWEIKLRPLLPSGVTLSIGQINFEDGKLFVAGSGVILCLDARDGKLIWINSLKGWGYGFVSMANVGNEAAASAVISAARTAAVVAAT